MTGHRRAWIVRKNRAARRRFRNRRLGAFRHMLYARLAKNYERVYAQLSADLWAVPNRMDMHDVEVSVQPFSMASESADQGLIGYLSSIPIIRVHAPAEAQ